MPVIDVGSGDDVRFVGRVGSKGFADKVKFEITTEKGEGVTPVCERGERSVPGREHSECKPLRQERAGHCTD